MPKTRLYFGRLLIIKRLLFHSYIKRLLHHLNHDRNTSLLYRRTARSCQLDCVQRQCTLACLHLRLANVPSLDGPFSHLKQEIRKEKMVGEEWETHFMGWGGGEENFRLWEVNSLCWLLSLLKIGSREGKLSWSEEGKAMGSELSWLCVEGRWPGC